MLEATRGAQGMENLRTSQKGDTQKGAEGRPDSPAFSNTLYAKPGLGQ